MPEVIFCLPLPKIPEIEDPNGSTGRPLTGNYLEKLTSEMSVKHLFKRISYLNNQNKWHPLKNFTSCQLFEIETFFFLFKKW